MQIPNPVWDGQKPISKCQHDQTYGREKKSGGVDADVHFICSLLGFETRDLKLEISD